MCNRCEINKSVPSGAWKTPDPSAFYLKSSSALVAKNVINTADEAHVTLDAIGRGNRSQTDEVMMDISAFYQRSQLQINNSANRWKESTHLELNVKNLSVS